MPKPETTFLSLPKRDRFLFIGTIAFLVVCALCGGASRADAQSQIIVRLVALVMITGVAATVPLRELRLRMPIYFLAAWVTLLVVQLIPLPPMLWRALPGRDFALRAADIAGQAQPWRPWSLGPDLTLNSVVAILPAFAMLLALAALPTRLWPKLAFAWAVICVVSAVLAVMQVASGDDNMYLYAISSFGYPNGLLANRNHQAVLLASGLPAIALWVSRETNGSRLAFLYGTGLTAFLVALIVASGSRAGLAWAAVGLAGAAMIAVPKIRRLSSRDRWLLTGMAGAAAITTSILLFSARALSVERLFAGDSATELRATNLGGILFLAKQYFPFGAGAGTFDPLFRMIEPDEGLTNLFFNHAHNELLELIITNGAFGLALLMLFLVWLLRATVRLYSQRADRRLFDFGTAGITIIVILLGSSLVDYPLRTPLLSTLFVMAVAWLDVRGNGSYSEAPNGARHPGTNGEARS